MNNTPESPLSLPLSNLSDTENRIAAAFMSGEAVSFNVGNPDVDNPENGQRWETDRAVRASFLMQALLAPAPIGRPRALTILGARIEGDLDLSASEVTYELNFINCFFDGSINISRSRLKTVNLVGSVLSTLSANFSEFTGNVRFDDSKACEITLVFSRISGQVSFTNAKLSNIGSVTLGGDGMTASGGLFFGAGFRSEGELRLPGARISGQLVFRGAVLLNRGGHAFLADGLQVEGGVYFTDHFKSVGELRLLNASIKGQLGFSEATLVNNDAVALNAKGMSSTEFLFSDRSKAFGSIVLSGARIGYQVSFSCATLVCPLGLAFIFQESQAQSLWLRETIMSGGIDLQASEINTINDDPAAWPARILLDGLKYKDLRPLQGARGSQGRLAWIERATKGYKAQPYEQLAAYYRQIGHDDDARNVLIAKNRRRRDSSARHNRIGGWILDAIAGYGYRPWWGLYWLVGLCAAGSLYFTAHPPLPTGPTAHLHFEPVLYVADLLLPIISLGQSSAWVATGFGQWLAAVLIALGWILVGGLAAALGHALFRD